MENQDRFQNLPYEMIFEVALGLDPKALFNLCLTSKSLSKICDDEIFWKNKLRNDFPGMKRTGKSYKDSYMLLSKQTRLTKILENLSEDDINWDELSVNPCLTQKFIEENLDKWDWEALSANPVITPDFVKRHPDLPWEWGSGGLSFNSSITPEFIKNNPKMPWDWKAYGISSNTSVTLEFLEENVDKWDYGPTGLSSNEGISLEFVKRHLDKGWYFQKLLTNKNITTAFLKSRFNIPEPFFLYLSRNPSITFKFIKENLDKEWDWGQDGFSSNTFNVDEKHLKPKSILSKIQNVPENLIEDKVIKKGLINQFDLFSDEVIWLIMLKMDYKTLSSFCSVSQRIKGICSDERFWKEKLQIEYPGETKSKNKTYRQLYKELSTYNTLERLVLTFPEKDWDSVQLSRNPSLTQKLIEYLRSPKFKIDHPDSNIELNMNDLSSNPVVTPDFVRKHWDWDWWWQGLSQNPSMTLRFIKETSDKPWDMDILIERNPYLTPEFVKDYDNIRFIAYNTNLC